MENTKLSSSFSIKQYRTCKASKDTIQISNLISERFKERYIEPFNDNKAKHGFSMMAISCLMIEALYSFKKGWKTSTGSGSGNDVFKDFFATSNYLNEFKNITFYSDIRCGLLHQAETYNCWKILRKGKLLNITDKTINATKFLEAINKELEDYIDRLKSEPYSSEL